MKTLFIGLVLGAIAAWSWYHTGGKIYITETKTMTNVVVVTVTETQIVEQLAFPYIAKTNEVGKTNIVEKLAQRQPVNVVAPIVQKAVEQPKAAQPVTQKKSPASTPTTITGLGKSRPAGKVTGFDRNGRPARRPGQILVDGYWH